MRISTMCWFPAGVNGRQIVLVLARDLLAAVSERIGLEQTSVTRLGTRVLHSSTCD